jgi:hypothetical protein
MSFSRTSNELLELRAVSRYSVCWALRPVSDSRSRVPNTPCIGVRRLPDAHQPRPKPQPEVTFGILAKLIHEVMGPADPLPEARQLPLSPPRESATVEPEPDVVVGVDIGGV